MNREEYVSSGEEKLYYAIYQCDLELVSLIT